MYTEVVVLGLFWIPFVLAKRTCGAFQFSTSALVVCVARPTILLCTVEKQYY